MCTASNRSIGCSNLHTEAQKGLPLLHGSFATGLKFPKDDKHIWGYDVCYLECKFRVKERQFSTTRNTNIICKRREREKNMICIRSGITNLTL
jgi:hypothetical protein